MNIQEIFESDLEEIKDLFRSVFTGPPWNEEWSDEEQLNEYLKDLIEVRGSLLFGLYEEEQLIGMSLGRIKHWYKGTEYFIEELCIRNDYQGKGYGRLLFELIGEKLKEHNLNTIFLMTDRNQPAYRFYQRLEFRELPELTSFYKEL
ncbi:MAG: GNAT family N-acetyltransferase [Lachnospiraceae bacterium]|nr:GNAT family N-acetyltransferase [Lachnospiraceae bacterium]